MFSTEVEKKQEVSSALEQWTINHQRKLVVHASLQT